jgi:hypothetical protein
MAYPHASGNSAITGGFRYRGCRCREGGPPKTLTPTLSRNHPAHPPRERAPPPVPRLRASRSTPSPPAMSRPWRGARSGPAADVQLAGKTCGPMTPPQLAATCRPTSTASCGSRISTSASAPPTSSAMSSCCMGCHVTSRTLKPPRSIQRQGQRARESQAILRAQAALDSRRAAALSSSPTCWDHGGDDSLAILQGRGAKISN